LGLVFSIRGEQDLAHGNATLPFPVLAGELKAATITPVGRAPGEPFGGFSRSLLRIFSHRSDESFISSRAYKVLECRASVMIPPRLASAVMSGA
jgi:hypothetical protein